MLSEITADLSYEERTVFYEKKTNSGALIFEVGTESGKNSTIMGNCSIFVRR